MGAALARSGPSEGGYRANSAVDRDAGGGAYVAVGTVSMGHSQVISSTPYLGGGLFLGSSPKIPMSNTINRNVSSSGGGLHLYGSAAILDRNTIGDNIATGNGGAVLL